MNEIAINPRTRHVLDAFQIEKTYESLVVSLQGVKDYFYIGPELTAKDIEEIYKSSIIPANQTKVPSPFMVSFLNMFLGGSLSCGVNATSHQPTLFYNHREIIDMQVWFPQDIYIIYLEDDIIRGDFGELHSDILRSMLHIGETCQE